MKMNRRDFIKMGGCASASALFGGLFSAPTIAQAPSDYRAAVCLFFLGGLDHNDTVIPRDAASYDLLADARRDLFEDYGVGDGSNSSSRERLNLLELSPLNSLSGGRSYGLPRELQPLHELFDDEELAIVGSVGALASQGTNRTSFNNRSVALPPRLFSHNDQQNYWQGFSTEGATAGWGGRIMDELIASRNDIDSRYSNIITSSSSLFLNGEQASPFRITSSGPLGLEVNTNRGPIDNNRARELVEQYLNRSTVRTGNFLKQDLVSLRADSLSSVAGAMSAYDSTPTLTTTFPNTSLGRQLQSVAQSIQARDSLGVSRQMFFASRGGFDTHSNQATTMPNLHNDVAGAIKAFRDAMVEIGMWDNVVLFTAADFGRSLVGNGGGTDHGWGSHHFVAGGSVRGKRIFGRLPSSDITSQEYTPTGGRLIPSVSIEEYGAPIGRWLGLNDQQINRVMPNLSSLSSSPLNLLS